VSVFYWRQSPLIDADKDFGCLVRSILSMTVIIPGFGDGLKFVKTPKEFALSLLADLFVESQQIIDKLHSSARTLDRSPRNVCISV
jgi:hypothetical protein